MHFKKQGLLDLIEHELYQDLPYLDLAMDCCPLKAGHNEVRLDLLYSIRNTGIAINEPR